MVTPLRFYCLFLLTDSLFHDNDNILCIGTKATGVEGNVAHQVLLKRDQRRKFLSLRNPVRTLGCGNPRGAAQPRSVLLPGRGPGDGGTDCRVAPLLAMTIYYAMVPKHRAWKVTLPTKCC